MIRFLARGARRAHTLMLTMAIGTASMLLPGSQGAFAQTVYPTPDAAANAFVDALARSDHDAMKHVLGNDFQRFIPTQNVGEEDILEFLDAWSKGHEIVNDPTQIDNHPAAHLVVGTSRWPLPIPLVQMKTGWRFAPAAGRGEILTRRIGRNERAAMMTALAYLDAQNDYRSLTQHYAQRFVSRPGQHDGLYWATAPGEAESPLGPLAAAMPHGAAVTKDGYHGYHYRILTAQGSHAKGGALNYAQDGVMTKGCALVAWPAEYGKTGVLSFIVNQDGQLYQKDLGPQGARVAAALRSFDPDSSWQQVQP